MFILTFLGRERFDHHHVHPHESPMSMLVPLVVLALLSAVGGKLPIPDVVAHVVGDHHAHAHAPASMIALAVAMAVGGLGLAWYCYVARPSLPDAAATRAAGLYALLRDKWRVDELYGALVVDPLFRLADGCARVFDPGVIDGLVNGSGALVRTASDAWRRVQTGNLQHVALSFVVGAILLLGLYVGR
jgi:NADH-quinone oxidoreductase subunit L